MIPDPILNATPVLHAHLAAAALAVLATPAAILRRSRDRVHKIAGYVWVAAMAALALTGLAIPAGVGPAVLGHFGAIHLLSVYVLWGLWKAVSAARAGRVAAHRGHVLGLSFGALGVAGLLTLLPGRSLNAAFFPATPQAGWLAIAVGLAMLAVLAWLPRMRRRGDSPLHIRAGGR